MARRARALRWRTDEAVIPFVCECGDSGCRGVTHRSLDEYEVARAEDEPLLVPGHEVDVGAHWHSRR